MHHRGILKPAIVGIEGLRLTQAETAAITAHQPAGIILFARNVANPEQLQSLTDELKATLPTNALIMVDQEGGRVARLRPPHWRPHPPARALTTERAAFLTGALIGLECAQAGFNLVAAPVLDVADPNGHDVIGDRAFSSNPAQVAALAAAFAQGLLAAGIQPIGKHAPGHGRARADSHLELPTLDDIADTDLIPFIGNRALPWLMTAHIRYMNRDMLPATHSSTLIATIIRAPDAIGFDGVLISDDLAMNALSGTPGDRARRAVAAGCDIALHCSGVLDDTLDVLDSLNGPTQACLARLSRARDLASASRQTLDARAMASERATLLA